MKSLLGGYSAWLTKVLGVRVGTPWTPSPLQVARTQAAMSKGYERNVRIRTLLDTLGVPVTSNYQGAAAEMQAVKAKHPGNPAVLAAVMAKWGSPGYGLNPMVLKKIEGYV